MKNRVSANVNNNETLRSLVEGFCSYAVLATGAVEAGKGNEAAKYDKEINKIWTIIRDEYKDDGVRALSEMLKDKRAEARVIAAVYLMRYNTDECIRVLKAEVGKKGMLSFQAEQAIKTWERGDWELK